VLRAIHLRGMFRISEHRHALEISLENDTICTSIPQSEDESNSGSENMK